LSADKLATLVAQGDIGQNDLTDVSKVYALGCCCRDRWYCHFYKRVNGALAIVAEKYSSWWITSGHIHMNTAVEGGG
jgi:hypothetical protein